MGRNNKKKNKAKPAETGKDLAVGNGEISLLENQDPSSEQKCQKQNSSDGESQNVGLQESDAELNPVNGVYGEKNVKLPEEDEKLAWPKKEAEFQEELKNLKEDILSCIKKEANLEKTIEQLQSGMDIYVQKEAMWGTKLEELQNEMCACLLTEANLKEQLRILGEESSHKVLTKESLLILENDNKMLHDKVIELEESRNHLVQENKMLIDNISLLQVRVQQLEEASLVEAKSSELSSSPKEEHTAGQVKAYHSAEELVVGRKEVVEKVNEPQELVADDGPSLATISLMSKSSATDKPDSGHAFESIPIHDAISTDYLDDQLAPLYVSRNPVQQLPSESEIQVEEVDKQAHSVVQESNTPLSDAPLIGAPFRLISFVAKYVSGSDLVKEQGSKAGR